MKPLSTNAREIMKAKAYIEDILASMVPSDPEFNEIWELIPDDLAANFTAPITQESLELLNLAEEIRAIKNRRYAELMDSFEA